MANQSRALSNCDFALLASIGRGLDVFDADAMRSAVLLSEHGLIDIISATAPAAKVDRSALCGLRTTAAGRRALAEWLEFPAGWGPDAVLWPTKHQLRVLHFICQHYDRHEYTPTRVEMSRGLGIAAGSVSHHVRALKDRGWLRLSPHAARWITVVHFPPDYQQRAAA